MKKTNVETQKTDDTALKTYRMIVSTFSVLDKDNKVRFFEESFLLANVKPNIVLKMPFLIMSNIDIDFKTHNS